MRGDGTDNQRELDQVVIENAVIEQIILESIIGAKGIIGPYQSRISFMRSPVKISNTKSGMKIRIYLTGEYGEDLKESGILVKNLISNSLEKLGGINVEGVDVIFKSVSRRFKD